MVAWRAMSCAAQASRSRMRIYRRPQANLNMTGHLSVGTLRLWADLPGLYLTGSAYRGVGIPDWTSKGRPQRGRRCTAESQSVDNHKALKDYNKALTAHSSH
jgi:hypothetical protein